MVHARRRGLDAGHFDALRAAVLDRIQSGIVLDVGCGEGFYTRPLAEYGRDWIGGIDLSRSAIRLAARRAPAIRYAVANAFDLPVQDCAIESLVCVFGPVAAAEFRRVLRPSGRLIVVSPGPQHLVEIKRVVFGEARGHPLQGPRSLGRGFRTVDTLHLNYQAAVQQPGLSDLFDMTPYKWQANPEGAARLASLRDLRVTLDFLVLTLERL